MPGPPSGKILDDLATSAVRQFAFAQAKGLAPDGRTAVDRDGSPPGCRRYPVEVQVVGLPAVPVGSR